LPKIKSVLLKTELSFSNGIPTLDDLKTALKPFNVHVIIDPRVDDEPYKFILSSRPLSLYEINEIDDNSFSSNNEIFEDDEEFDIDEF